MLEIILTIIVVISLLLFIFVIINNRFALSIIKIEKAEEDIELYLQKKQDFNQLIATFPSSVVAFFKRYKKKDFYNNEKREIFEILNEK